MNQSNSENHIVPDQSRWPWLVDNVASSDSDLNIVWPKISVITPSYNQADFLEATLRSVICQGYPNLEYIVLDGGSTDGSPAIIKKYEANLKYWHSKKDLGQADALSTGFAMATGEIQCWVNSDDILLPGALFHVAKLFIKNKRIGFVYGNRIVIDEQGNEIGRQRWPLFLTRYHWARGQYLAQECCFWRSGVYREAGGINASKFFIMDYDLFYRMWLCTKFRKTAAYLGCIRIHDETKNSKFQDIWEKELKKAVAGYGLKAPGYLRLRFLNRFDRLQLMLESALARLFHAR